MAIFVAILLALLVAAASLLAAGARQLGRGTSARRRSRTFRSGWAGRENPDADQRAAAARGRRSSPSTSRSPQFLAETADEGEAYLQVDDLAATLQRARDKAVGALPRQPRLTAERRPPG